MPRKTLQLPVVEVEFFCFNCDETLIVTKHVKLFCSDKCRQEAAFVRYFRSHKRDGRIYEPGVRETLKMKMAQILSGVSERRLSKSTRQKIYERDNRTCQKCGQPASDIYHINGSSDNLENLQMLCRICHDQKTTANFVQLTPEVEEYEEKKAIINSLLQRAKSVKPQQICDDDENWNANYKIILADMREILKSERMLALANNEGFDTSNFEKETAQTKNL